MVADSDLPNFRGYSRQRGREFAELEQTIGRTAIPFLRRYVVPAEKRVDADLLDTAAPEIGNVLTGKKFKSVAADVGKKTLRKQLSGGKIRKRRIIWRISPKTSRRRRTRRDIFSKLKWVIDQQTIATFVMVTLWTLAWRFLTKFLFWKQLNLLTFKKFITVHHWMKAALNSSLKHIEAYNLIWEISTFKSKLVYKREDCLMTLKDEHGKTDIGMSFTDDDLHYISNVNNLLQSLFSNCEVYLNNQQGYN